METDKDKFQKALEDKRELMSEASDGIRRIQELLDIRFDCPAQMPRLGSACEAPCSSGDVPALEQVRSIQAHHYVSTTPTPGPCCEAPEADDLGALRRGLEAEGEGVIAGG